MAFTEVFHKRTLYYWSKLHSSQLDSSQGYENINQSICINIMGQRSFKSLNDQHLIFEVLEQKHHIKLCKDMEIHYIQLPLIDDTIEVSSMDRLTEWMTIVKDIHLPYKQKTINQIGSKESVMQMALDEYSKINEDDLIREKLAARQRFVMDMNTNLNVAVARGEARGEAKGEIAAKHQIALKMLSESYSVEQISSIIGLISDEIKGLNN